MKPTRVQIQDWEARLDIGWPADSDELREWREQDVEPEHTLATLEVPSPPAEFIRRLEHHTHGAKTIPALRRTVTAWQRAQPVAAIDVCITAHEIGRRDDDASLWLGDALWELLEWSTWPASDQRQALRTFKRDLRAQARQRTKALAEVENAIATFLDSLRADWRPFDPDDYLDSLRAWQHDWLA